MKIYTKGGDSGQTSLIGGKRVPKYHKRIEAYGTVDELIAYIGLLRDTIQNKDYQNKLIHIQDRLMTAASLLAAKNEASQKNLPKLYEKDIEFLEKEIDKMESQVKPLQTFILPGGNSIVSFCHIARTVCRRSERLSVKLSINSGQDKLVIKYLNRLSDFLFVFSRLISKELGIEEIPWKPIL